VLTLAAIPARLLASLTIRQTRERSSDFPPVTREAWRASPAPWCPQSRELASNRQQKTRGIPRPTRPAGQPIPNNSPICSEARERT
jgi:hypothetical protein